MRHPKAVQWERRLKAVFDGIDEALEARYGSRYALRPGRPAHGKTANREHDGLFNVGAAFSAGYGSEHGRGYVVEVRMSTAASLPSEARRSMYKEVARLLEERLPKAFPGRDLQVVRDGNAWKIVGDLGLGGV